MPGFIVSGIGGNRGGINPARSFYTSYTWELTNINSALGNRGYVSNGVTLLRTCNLPQATFEKVKVDGGTIPYKFAGKPNFEDIRISWYDHDESSNLYRGWYDLIFDTNVGVKAPNAYKGNATIVKYLNDRPDIGDTSHFAASENSGNTEYNLFGAWPTAFKESELTYLEASIKSIEITVTYDYFEMEYLND